MKFCTSENFPLYRMVAIFHGYIPRTHSGFPRQNQLWYRCCPQDVTHMHDEIKLTRPSPIPVLEYCKQWKAVEAWNEATTFFIIGASLSELHTCVTSLRLYVCMFARLLAWINHLL